MNNPAVASHRDHLSPPNTDLFRPHIFSHPGLSVPGEYASDVSASFINHGRIDQNYYQSLLPTFVLNFATMSSIGFLVGIFKLLAILGMVLGGVVVFIPQYLQIWKSGNSEGFSTHVCLILIVANLMRMCFWFAVRFETPLLLQSIFVTIAMLAMQELCVRCKLKKCFTNSRQKTKRFMDLDFDYFWNWTYFSDYLYFLSIFFVFIAFMTNLFIDSDLFIDTLGFVAVCTEAVLLLPQLLQNFKRKSTDGLSVSMVLMMLAGDVFKTCYYVTRSVPSQFWICSSLQCSIDIAILYQVCYYGSSKLSARLSQNEYNKVPSLNDISAHQSPIIS